MKAISQTLIALSLGLATSVFAKVPPQEMRDDMANMTTTGVSMEQMQKDVERACSQFDRAESDKERQQVVQDHMQAMRESMGMTRQVTSGNNHVPSMNDPRHEIPPSR